jgi:hypothetical protein
MLLPVYKAAREIGVGVRFLYRAVQEGALPDDAVIRVGPKRVLIDLKRRDDIVRAAWAAKERPRARAGRMSDREARLKRIVGGGE